MFKIFNTLSKKKELFTPFVNKNVNIYVCGVTTSDYCHIGHGRTFYFFDVLIKYLKYLGYKCNYIRNITDIDNKIIEKSISKNIPIKDLSNIMINSMYNDFNNLNLSSPNLEPKITDNVNIIILSIIKLLKYNYAYISKNGDVLFSYKYFYNNLNKNYFSNLKYKKNNEKDFVLWKLNKISDLSGWNSPWGLGRPGWHIECSVISNKYLNNIIDIHGGGSDLIFPHHENELIQSKCLFGINYNIKYWVHTGLVTYNGNKLSKSKKKQILLNKLLYKYFPDVIKYYLLSKHYRKNLDFNIKILDICKKSINKLYLGINDLDLNLNFNKNDILSLNYYDNIFLNYMNNDFNIPGVHKLFFLMLSEINKFKNKKFILASKLAIKMKFYASFLGLLQYNSKYFLSNKYFYNNIKYLKLINKINYLINSRNKARKENNWEKADFLRKKLINLNVMVKDEKNFITKWYFIN